MIMMMTMMILKVTLFRLYDSEALKKGKGTKSKCLISENWENKKHTKYLIFLGRSKTFKTQISLKLAGMTIL